MLVINRIEVSNFRRLRGPVRIDALGPGLTVIAGDNEEGKSTLLEAIRAALFEKHNLTGGAAGRLQPFGSVLCPHVAMDFTLDGDPYRIEKGFCQRPSAELTTPTGRYADQAAEDRLRELLNFESPGRGASKPEHHGVWGLLFIEQGTAYQPMEVSDLGRRTLQEALQAQVGNVLGGRDGEELIARIENAYAQYFTINNGRPTGDLKDAQQCIPALESQLRATEEQLREFDSKLLTLERLEREMKDELHPDRGRELVALREKARDMVAQLQSLEDRVARADQAVRMAKAEVDASRQRWEARRREIGTLATLTAKQQELAADRAAAELALTTLDGRLRSSDDSIAANLAAVESARRQLQRLTALAQRAERGAEVERLREQLQLARSAEEARLGAQRDLATIALPDDLLPTLRELSTGVAEAQAQLSVIATTLVLDLNTSVQIDGHPVDAKSRLELTRPASLVLGELGRIDITPGGRGIAEAEKQLKQLQTELHEALAEHDLADLPAAERRAELARALKGRIDTERARIDAISPEGFEKLQQHLAVQEGQLAQLDAQLGEVDSTELQVPAAAIANADLALWEAEQQAGAAARNLEDLRDERERTHTAYIQADTKWDTARSDSARLRSELEAEREQLADDRLTSDLLRAEQAVAAAGQGLVDAQCALESADPAARQSDLATAEAAVQAFEERRHRMQTQIMELRGELRGQGHEGLGERQQALTGALEAARLRAEALNRQAAVVALLRKVLREVAGEAREHFLLPITARVAPLLRRLFPNDRLVLGENLEISAIDRDGGPQPFSDLSVGTREQLAILTRLAFAQLLVEQGRPAMLVLDDALVYSDADRFERMKLILAQAAQHFQILLLTCRPGDYLSLGAPTVRLM